MRAYLENKDWLEDKNVEKRGRGKWSMSRAHRRCASAGKVESHWERVVARKTKKEEEKKTKEKKSLEVSRDVR